MTEKRFKEIISIETVIDNMTGKEYHCLLDDDLFNLINELAEENKQLKQKVNELELLNDGLKYVLENVKRIDVEVNLND